MVSVLDVALPDGPDLPVLTQSFAACVASAIEIPVARLRLPRLELPGAMRHPERLITKGVLRGLIHRGGLRADILTDGRIRIGSAIETLD
jgi:hypothetical protein